MNYDVFNGDADGICALLQLRLAEPIQASLITGVKRDIQLLQQLETRINSQDRVTVLDISMARNLQSLNKILKAGARVLYVDHHQAGMIPEHSHLDALIDTDANICTSLLVDQRLQGRYRAWAVVAAFGDNLQQSAIEAAKPLNLSEDQLLTLKTLGMCLNYNGYGADVEDLFYPPDELFHELLPFDNPFAFIEGNSEVYERLREGYEQDMRQASTLKPEFASPDVAVFMLPDATWSRRVGGVFGNQLANQNPDRAHAVISVNLDQSYLVSVRAPLNNKTGADTLCQSFETGGGRKAAAGINRLPVGQLQRFIDQFSSQYAAP